MRSSILKTVAGALVIAAVLVPAAAAMPHHSTLKLALVPLPKARLGSAAAGLNIAPGSGPRAYLRAYLGSTRGYELDYGSPFLGNPGLDAVSTSVDEYKTARAAKRALKKTKKLGLGSGVGNFTQLNLIATEAPLSVPAVGDRHSAAVATYSVPNYGSLYFVIEVFCDGKYVLDVFVAAGSQDLAMSYAASKARVLDKRLHRGLSGRLHGHRVALPFPKPGPPANGPDPATAVLQTSDLPGSEIVEDAYRNSYSAWGALSEYDRYLVSNDPTVSQIVTVWPSTNSAGFFAAYLGGDAVELSRTSFGRDSAVVTPVDVSAAGDEAQAAIVSFDPDSENGDLAVITLHSGPVSDFLMVEVNATMDASEVQTLAQAAATRLDAALP